MDLDKRSRNWIVTFPWNDGELPDSNVIPSIGQVFSYAMMSRDNGSVSTWFKFDNAQRASTVSSAYDHVHLVLKATNWDEFPAFRALPCDWSSDIKIGDRTHTSDLDENPNEQRDGTACTHSRPRTTVGSEHKHLRDDQSESSDDEFIADYRRLKRLRREILHLQQERSAVVDRIRCTVDTIDN